MADGTPRTRREWREARTMSPAAVMCARSGVNPSDRTECERTGYPTRQCSRVHRGGVSIRDDHKIGAMIGAGKHASERAGPGMRTPEPTATTLLDTREEDNRQRIQQAPAGARGRSLPGGA